MLTVMCPNCRHRFPAPGCCGSQVAGPPSHHQVVTTVSLEQPTANSVTSGGALLLVDAAETGAQQPQQVTISTQCGIQSGGCLIQSSNAEILLRATTTSSPRLEVRSKLSGGSCHVQQDSRIDDGQQQQEATKLQQQQQQQQQEEQDFDSMFNDDIMNTLQRSANCVTTRIEFPNPAPPSGCQELPGTRRENYTQSVSPSPPPPSSSSQPHRHQSRCDCRCCCYCRCCHTYCRNASSDDAAGGRSCCCGRTSAGEHVTTRCRAGGTEETARSGGGTAAEGAMYTGDVRIQVNATVCLPSTSSSAINSCTFNITASTTTTSTSTCNSELTFNNHNRNNNNHNNNVINRFRNNFNGGGIVTAHGLTYEAPVIDNNRLAAPSTPISWLSPCAWPFEHGYVPEPTSKDVARLAEVRRLLQTCGWYHEGLSWQQSESLLKDSPIGRWLMRDSSDSRYAFAISVQTARGPTSVRVFYMLGKFRLDAEPRLALAMPMFDCPVRMLEYYREYSRRLDEHRREVWVDYSGQVYSQIYLAEPYVKEVRSLKHLARVAVNKNANILEREREKLPQVIRNYLNEHPYTL